MPQVTHVNLNVDQHALQTIKMGLAAMQLSAATVEADINMQVQAQVEAAATEAQPKAANGKNLNGHGVVTP